MRHLLLVILLAGLVAGDAGADPPKPGFWRALVKKKARWVLEDAVPEGKSRRRVVVETYDVRKVGDADVARLRFTHIYGKKPGERDEEAAPLEGGLGQVAVTPAGLYLLGSAAEDAEIAARLTKKPSRSDPPKEYGGTKTNQGRYLHLQNRGDETIACMGYEPGDDAPPCEDTCFGEVCISPTAGVVSIGGTYAPSMGLYAQRGYENGPPPQ